MITAKRIIFKLELVLYCISYLRKTMSQAEEIEKNSLAQEEKISNNENDPNRIVAVDAPDLVAVKIRYRLVWRNVGLFTDRSFVLSRRFVFACNE